MSCFNVQAYGARGDGSQNDGPALQRAVDACADGGGGTVYVPAGRYPTGSIELKSNTTLHLDAGALLLGLEDYSQYPVVGSERIPGMGRMRTALVAAFEAENVAITGRGVIDGQGWHWWHKEKLRPQLVEFVLCTNIRIEGITLRNSPRWTVHPLCCDNVTVDGITIVNPSDSPNTDGINPESCSNVRISNCHINVGDDCVTIKSGKETDDLNRSRPCENITVSNCTMLHGHGGVVVGSEMSGSIRNVTITNCVFRDTDRGIRLKSRRRRGGVFEDVRVSNIVMDEVLCPFVINLYYRCGADPEDPSLLSDDPQPVTEETPVARNISFSHITARKVRAAAGFLYGLPEMPIQGVRFDNIVIETTTDPDEVGGEPAMVRGIDDLAGEGLICKNVRDIDFSSVQIETRQGPALAIESGAGVVVTDFTCRRPHRDTAVLKLRHVRGAVVRDCVAREGCGVFLEVAGTETENIVAIGNYLDPAERGLVVATEVPPGAVVERS